MSGYTPLFDTLLSGTLYGKWPHTGVWACLLSRVSREGLIDETPQCLASAIGIDTDTLMRCINDFMQPDADSRSAECDGRRLERIDEGRSWGWRVINHSKYKEKARKRNYDQTRTESGKDAERKRMERATHSDVPTRPDASRDLPLSSPTPTPSPLLKSATDVAFRSRTPREESDHLWPQVKAAIRDAALRKPFGEGTDVHRIVGEMGGWRQLGERPANLIGQTEQRFKNAYVALQVHKHGT